MCALRYDRQKKVNYKILKTNKIINHPKQLCTSTIEPVINNIQQFRTLKRLIGVFLTVLAFLFAELLNEADVTLKIGVAVTYICVQIYLWSDIQIMRVLKKNVKKI